MTSATADKSLPSGGGLKQCGSFFFKKACDWKTHAISQTKCVVLRTKILRFFHLFHKKPFLSEMLCSRDA